MAIEATTPTVIPASNEKTYDKWWIVDLKVSGANPPTVNFRAELKKYHEDEEGNIEFAPGPSSFLSMNDLFAIAEEDEEMQTLLSLIFTKVKKEGDKQGIL